MIQYKHKDRLANRTPTRYYLLRIIKKTKDTMAGFPPIKAQGGKTVEVADTPAVSTGNQSLAQTIKKNDAGIKVSPGNDKSVNEF
jgi:hypothetical protein